MTIRPRNTRYGAARRRPREGRPAGGPLGRLALALVATSVLAGCATTRPIGRLLDDPYRFDGETVRVEGRVVQAAGALGYGAYQVDDGTGTLYVVSDGHGVPRQGARVRVSGRFQALLTVGRTSVAGLVEEKRRSRR